MVTRSREANNSEETLKVIKVRDWEAHLLADVSLATPRHLVADNLLTFLNLFFTDSKYHTNIKISDSAIEATRANTYKAKGRELWGILAPIQATHNW